MAVKIVVSRELLAGVEQLIEEEKFQLEVVENMLDNIDFEGEEKLKSIVKLLKMKTAVKVELMQGLYKEYERILKDQSSNKVVCLEDYRYE